MPRSSVRSARLRRVALAMVLGAILPVALTASPVAAGVNNIVLFGYLGDCSFLGFEAGNQKSVTIEWRDSDNRLKSKHKVTSFADGSFQSRCEFDELIESGDTIKHTRGGMSHTVTVPKLTINVDRDTNLAGGKGPAGETVEVGIAAYNGGFGAPTVHVNQDNTDGSGNWSIDVGSAADPVDVRGWDDAIVFFETNRGDIFGRAISVQGVEIHIGRPWVNIAGNPREDILVQVTDGASTIFGETGGRLDFWGEYGGQFLDDDGDSVRPLVGQSIVSNHASDGDFVIPDVSANPNASTDRVPGDCGGDDGIGWLVRVHTRNYTVARERRGFTNLSGNFNANFSTGQTYNIKSGDKVDVFCKLESGDVVARGYTVP